MCMESQAAREKVMHTDRRHRHKSSKERCRVVDLIKINIVRQESNHRDREEQKH